VTLVYSASHGSAQPFRRKECLMGKKDKGKGKGKDKKKKKKKKK
jgi:hypothetical protein